MGKGRVQHQTGGDKLTQQHFADAADINKIMHRHLAGGPLQGPGRPSGRKPMYMNLTGQSYHEMLCQVQEVQGQFAALPSKVRKRFANNPQRLVEFLEDPENLKEAMEIGLIQEEDLSEDKKAQLDLVRESDKKDREEFEAWKQSKERAKARAGSEDDDDPFEKEDKPAKNAGRKRTS